MAAGLAADVQAAAQHFGGQLERQDVARPAEQVHRDHRGAAHGVDVGERVHRGDPAPVVRVGLPCHWGPNGLSRGAAANDLLSIALDPNVHIQESEAATCDIRPGRRPRGAALPELVAEYRRRADG